MSGMMGFPQETWAAIKFMYLTATRKMTVMAGFVSATHPLTVLVFPFRRGFVPCFRGFAGFARRRDAFARLGRC